MSAFQADRRGFESHHPLSWIIVSTLLEKVINTDQLTIRSGQRTGIVYLEKRKMDQNNLQRIEERINDIYYDVKMFISFLVLLLLIDLSIFSLIILWYLYG